jgi:hypothetical protein
MEVRGSELSQSGRFAEVRFGKDIWHVTRLTILNVPS